MSGGTPAFRLAGPRGLGPYLGLLLLFGLVQVQATVMPEAALGPSRPMLPVLAVIVWAILRGPSSGLWWALALGWMLDWRSPEPVGTYTLPMLSVALVGALGSRRVFANNLLLPGVLTVLGTVVFLLVQQALIGATGASTGWDREALTTMLLPAVALDLLWLPVVFFPLRAFAARFEDPRIGWER